MNFLEAATIADAWFKLQTDLPSECILSSGRLSQTGRWVFEVQLRHIDKMFDILTLSVTDAEVIILRDRRMLVKDLLSNPEGYTREARLIRVAQERTANTPEWFISAEPSITGHDMNGADGFAKVKITERQTLRVPFDVKSSEYGVRKYFTQYPDRRGLFAVFAVRDDQSDEQIRGTLYTHLDNVRDAIKWSGRSLTQVKEIITRQVHGRAQE